MSGTKQRRDSRTRHHNVWFAAIVGNRSQTSRAAAFDFIRRKRWMKYDVGDQIERSGKILAESTRPYARSIHVGAGKQCSAQQCGFISNLRGVTFCCALLQHIRGETGEARLIDRIRAASRIENQVNRNDRQSGPVVVNNRETIIELEYFRNRKIQLWSRSGLRRIRTPRRFRVDGLASLVLALHLRL